MALEKLNVMNRPSKVLVEPVDTSWHKQLMFIGKDGKDYATVEALIAANEAHFRQTHRYLVHDAMEGRREIAPGTGEVQICVGYEKVTQRGPDGKYMGTEDVPIFETKTF